MTERHGGQGPCTRALPWGDPAYALQALSCLESLSGVGALICLCLVTAW